MPAQAAQLAAYNAEAGQLNSAQQTAVSNLELCLQQVARARAMAALAGVEPGGPPVPGAPFTIHLRHERDRWTVCAPS